MIVLSMQLYFTFVLWNFFLTKSYFLYFLILMPKHISCHFSTQFFFYIQIKNFFFFFFVLKCFRILFFWPKQIDQLLLPCFRVSAI